jgi:hypothetical protein
MPYARRWIKPAKFLTRKGVSVYHTHREDDAEGVMNCYWFVTNPSHGEDGSSSFDVRDLAAYAKATGATEDERIKNAIKAAIDSGELVAGE